MDVQKGFAFASTIVKAIAVWLWLLFLTIVFICVGVVYYRIRRAGPGVQRRVSLKAAIRAVFCLADWEQTGANLELVGVGDGGAGSGDENGDGVGNRGGGEG